MEYHEVAVVGGGPAGSTCASELAKNGVDVVLFDHSHPREKPCGGGIPKILLNNFKISKSILQRMIHYIILEDQNNNHVELYEKFGGAVIMRRKFDHYLLKEAMKNGTKFIDKKIKKLYRKNKLWVLESGRKKFKSKIIVGADGCPSLVRKIVSKPIPEEHLFHAVGYHILQDKKHMKEKFKDAVEFYILGKPYFDKGYIWIFPKLNYVNIGIITKLGTKDLKIHLDNFIKSHPAAKRILIPKKIIFYSHLVPSVSNPNFFNIPTSGRDWMLIGDAAGHVNPITGGGIYYAMMGGKLAAKAYIGGDISLYENYWRKSYGSDLYWGARVQSLFYNSIINTTLIKVSRKSKTMREIAADIIAPRVPYNEIFTNKLPFSIVSIIFEMIF